jgi:hypothetical protein
MTERRYQMTRVGPGDYLLPSNDGKTIWRIARYHEGGTLERDDGSKVIGDFWGVWRYAGRVPDLLNAAFSLDLVWPEWEMWDSLLKTRREAVDVAVKARVA